MPIKKDSAISEILADGGDLLTLYGAACIARAIEHYWHKRGHLNVQAKVFEIPGSRGTWGVQSNLVGGMPTSG